MIVDTHTHLYLPDFEDPAAAVERALAAGVGHMVFPNVDLTTIEPMKRLHALYPSVTSMAMGLHPTEVTADYPEALAVVEDQLAGGGYVAVGEIGVDLYWDRSFRDLQMQAFERQCSLAERLGIPVIIHCREALDEVLEVVSGFKGLKGVMHSFTGTPDDVGRVRRVADFYFGINGIVTFKNARLRESLPAVGMERLLLETDSPYLAPVPHRGKRCESAFIVSTCQAVASALSLSPDEVAVTTAENAALLGLV